MMREILFRGMGSSGEWFYGFLSYTNDKRVCGDLGYFISNKAGSPFAYDVTPETVGEYTGVEAYRSCRTGEHALKIFEGDILEDVFGRIYNVEFRDGVFLGVTTDDYAWDPVGEIGCKIIGNVHQTEMILK